MAVNNLVFTRVDDRLIHGQVMTSWLKVYNTAKHILIVDDATSKDPFMGKMFSLLVPSGITISVQSVDEAVETFKAGLPQPTVMIVKVPLTIKRLIDAGVDIDYFNIGGMGMSAGRKKFFQNISMSDEEKQICRELTAKGVRIEIQIVPAQSMHEVSKLL